MIMNKKYLGIDYGTKKVGIAISDDAQQFAFPREVVTNDAHLLSHIKTLCAEEGIAQIVIGESTDYQGKENPVMEEIKAFIPQLQSETGLPVALEPEFMTSAHARVLQGKHGMIDASAAALILQTFLDKQQKRREYGV